MYTLIFTERDENKDKMIVDFQLSRNNYWYSPPGRIRIARFERSFSPLDNSGYYGDIYMKKFIRKWRKRTYENIQRRKDRIIANEILYKHTTLFNDTINIIIEFV